MCRSARAYIGPLLDLDLINANLGLLLVWHSCDVFVNKSERLMIVTRQLVLNFRRVGVLKVTVYCRRPYSSRQYTLRTFIPINSVLSTWYDNKSLADICQQRW